MSNHFSAASLKPRAAIPAWTSPTCTRSPPLRTPPRPAFRSKAAVWWRISPG